MRENLLCMSRQARHSACDTLLSVLASQCLLSRLPHSLSPATCRMSRFSGRSSFLDRTPSRFESRDRNCQRAVLSSRLRFGSLQIRKLFDYNTVTLSKWSMAHCQHVNIEYWMMYGVPGLLAVVGFGSSPYPSVGKLNRERVTTCWRERRGGVGGGAKSYDGEKAWSFMLLNTPCM